MEFLRIIRHIWTILENDDFGDFGMKKEEEEWNF